MTAKKDCCANELKSKIKDLKTYVDSIEQDIMLVNGEFPYYTVESSHLDELFKMIDQL